MSSGPHGAAATGSSPIIGAPLAATIVCPDGAVGAIRALIDRLSNSGIMVESVDEIAEAADYVLNMTSQVALILDCRKLATEDPQDVAEAGAMIRRCRALVPDHRPIIVVQGAPNSFIVAVIRAGACDVIDLALEGTTHARAVVVRACGEMATRRLERENHAALRAVVEDFLRELIRTERQKIDLEEKLSTPFGDLAGALRNPIVLLVEDDRTIADRLTASLEEKGVTTFAFLSGEDAIRDARSAERVRTHCLILPLSISAYPASMAWKPLPNFARPSLESQAFS
jgi:FixJ family two-component response regulator